MMKGCKHCGRHRVRRYLLATAAACGLGALFARAAVKVVQTLTGDDALQHLEETNTVCGAIASARFLEGAPGNPTYLNFDRPYPNQSCAAVIAGAARPKFKVPPETAFMGKWVCVTGLITTNSRGKVEIAVSDPAQIVVQNAPFTPPTNQTAATPAP
jgi:hypothetical protein